MAVPFEPFDTYPAPAHHGSLGSLGVDLSTLPGAQQAWAPIQAQMEGEGQSIDNIGFAKDQFDSALQNAAAGGLDASNAYQAASALVTASHTVIGTVAHVQGLIGAAQGGDVTTVYNTFMGTMLSIAAVAGVAAPGIGAAIVAGIGVALYLLQNAGLFGGGAPIGFQLPGCSTNTIFPTQATIQVGCMGMFGATGSAEGGAIKQGSALWRHFPKPSGGNKNDDVWYITPSQWLNGYKVDTSAGPVPNGGPWVEVAFGKITSFLWSGSANAAAVPYSWAPAAFGFRFIDVAFPDYHYLNCETTIPGLKDFQTAFRTAWMANQEYALNGIKPQDNYVILDNLVRVWNRSHDSSSYVDVAPAYKTVIKPPNVASLTWPCPANIPPLFQTAISDLFSQSSPQTQQSLINGKLRINTGALLPVKRHLNIPRIATVAPSTSAAAAAPTTGLSTGGKVAITAGAVTAASAIGIGIFAWASGETFKWALDKTWKKVREPFKHKRRR